MRFAINIDTRAIQNPRMVSAIVRGMLAGVVAQNRVLIRTAKLHGRPYPALYKSGVVYGQEPWPDEQQLCDLRDVLARGWGDCKHLSCWRIAELLEGAPGVAQEHCANRPLIYWRRKPSGKIALYHAEVRRADGSREDPSRFLGM